MYPLYPGDQGKRIEWIILVSQRRARMYSVGSKIVHPFYGAGTIVKIQEKSLGEMTNQYYVIDTVPGPRELQVMVPVKNAADVGLREVGDAESLRALLASACTPPEERDVVHDFRKRRTLITECLKSGSFSQVVDAVRMLHFMSIERTLSMTDRALLDQGKEILASELALSAGADLQQAMIEIETDLGSMASSEA
jgi:CarD family transcriptional regulator